MRHRPKHRSRARRGAGFVVVAGTLVAVFAAAGIAAVATAGVLARHRLASSAARNGGTPVRLPPESLVPDGPDPIRPRPATLPRPAPVFHLQAASLRIGDEGPEVEALQFRLNDLGYVIEDVDGRFGDETHHALVAFQKVNGLAPDGNFGQETLKALDRPVRLRPRSAAPGFHVEVDIPRQVLFLVQDGRVTEIYDSSTGSGQPYEVDGVVAIARTPVGTFEVERKIDGLRESVLGTLYRPAYFIGGYAIHGNPSVPPYPASHGCVRVTNQVMDRLFDRLVIGTPVIVY